MNIKLLLKTLSIPLIIVVFSLAYNILWEILNWPKGDELIALITDFFNKYGLWVVFVCSILESSVVVGNYFPGGVVIFLGVISAGANIPKVVLIVAIVCAGFSIGYTIDYLLGKYGWYKLLTKFGMGQQIETAKARLEKHSFKAIAASYWEVNLASITATAAGILKIDFKRFFLESTIALIILNIIWGILVASLGKNALKLLFNWKYIIPIVSVWILVLVVIEYIKHKKNTPLESAPVKTAGDQG